MITVENVLEDVVRCRSYLNKETPKKRIMKLNQERFVSTFWFRTKSFKEVHNNYELKFKFKNYEVRAETLKILLIFIKLFYSHKKSFKTINTPSKLTILLMTT